jgi:NAD(P)-dependent dehydrogenase (short-subunit alcohol dehydrogenase family)
MRATRWCAPDAAQRAALRGVVRCRAEAVTNAGVWYGPGSAERMKNAAPRPGHESRGRERNLLSKTKLRESKRMTLFDMAGKVAVITGSTRGIGRAIAERMAEHGAKVVVSSRKQDVCDQVTREINDKFGKGTAVAIAANISSKENLQNLVSESNRAFGRIDVLVCNAASNPYYGPLGGISDDQFRKILDNNIVANNWLINMVVPQMIERKDGAIVIVSSIGGLKGSTNLGAYAISKAADMQLARNLACEYGRHNIRVNCIAPGLIKTDFAKALWDNPDNLKAATSRSPLLRIGTPDEIAGAAVFLGSAAGNFMTGQSIVIDGGATIS